MKGLIILFALIVLLIGAGGVVLATWDFAVPTRTIEKVIPGDRLGR